MRRVTAATLLALAVNGCSDPFGIGDIELPYWSGCFTLCSSEWPVEMIVIPGSVNLLVGDTVRETLGSGIGTWTSSSDAVAFITVDGFTSTVTSPTREVLLKALRPGLAEIDVRIDTTRNGRYPIRVADSSAIATISFWGGSMPPSLTVGAVIAPIALLRDAEGREFRGAPTEWTSSDSLVVAIANTAIGVRLVANRAGSATITAKFLAVSQTTTITVVP